MKNMKCLQCGKDLSELKSRQKYCSYECYCAFRKAKYIEGNPTTLKGKNTATTGAISELRVAVDLLSKDYNVFRALSPACPCDLAILKDDRLLRIEVRTSFISATGKIFKTKDKSKVNDVDVFAWVLPDRIIYEPALE